MEEFYSKKFFLFVNILFAFLFWCMLFFGGRVCDADDLRETHKLRKLTFRLSHPMSCCVQLWAVARC